MIPGEVRQLFLLRYAKARHSCHVDPLRCTARAFVGVSWLEKERMAPSGPFWCELPKAIESVCLWIGYGLAPEAPHDGLGSVRRHVETVGVRFALCCRITVLEPKLTSEPPGGCPDIQWPHTAPLLASSLFPLPPQRVAVRRRNLPNSPIIRVARRQPIRGFRARGNGVVY